MCALCGCTAHTFSFLHHISAVGMFAMFLSGLENKNRISLRISQYNHNHKPQGSDGTGFKGDLYLVFRLLLPAHPKRVFNMKDKQLV